MTAYQWIDPLNCHGKGDPIVTLDIKHSSEQLSSVRVYPSICYILLLCFNNGVCKKPEYLNYNPRL